jgi:hypothetical protein
VGGRFLVYFGAARETVLSGDAKRVKRAAPVGLRKPDAEGVVEPRGDRARVVRELLRKIERKLGGADVKATLSDYIKLLQLQKEIEEEEPKEIKVTWVEKTPTSGSGN